MVISILVSFLVCFAQPHQGWWVPQMAADEFTTKLAATREDHSQTLVLLIGFSSETRHPWDDSRVKEWLSAHSTTLSLAAYGPYEERASMSGLLPQPPEGRGVVAAYRNGELFDRDANLASPDDVLDWLALVEKGQMSLDYASQRAGERTPQNFERHKILAERLARAGKMDESDSEYEWWYERGFSAMLESTDPRKFGISWDPICSAGAKALASRDPTVKSRLLEIRNRLRTRAEGPPEDELIRLTWLYMCRDFPDSDHVVEWFAKHREEQPEAESAKFSLWLQVCEVLIADDRWADAGRFVTRPLGAVGEAGQMLRFAKLSVDSRRVRDPQRDTDDYKAAMKRELNEAIAFSAKLYPALLAAGREDDARRVAQTTFEELDPPFVPDVKASFVEIALRAGQPRPVHATWAAEADSRPAAQVKLLPQVEAALKGGGQ